jgi:hypothetical protein
MPQNQTDFVTQPQLDDWLDELCEKWANRIVGDLTEAFLIHFVEPINERFDRLEERFDSFDQRYDAIEALHEL